MNPAPALRVVAVGVLVSAAAFGQEKLASTQPASKTGTIKGRVVAAETGLGLNKATITVLARPSQLSLEFGRNENSFVAKSHAMNTSVSKTGQNGL